MLTARLADGSPAVTVPGYSATSTSPQGTHLTPDDRSLLPGARNISVGPRLGADPGECVYGAQVCEVESPTLLYERFTDTQDYVRNVGGMQFEVRGGLAVDRAVLRAAVLSARPATDDEALAMLPPPRPSTPDRSVRGAVRELARDLFGGR
ncbi:hypothetical protein [Nocardia sp. NRRL S-836]|uniref:hypothetical protein n=1 Tax=Nocardia sp. NRRL S-836 TaxID=1519492 RepID=UPI0006AFC315|nr:hypothetical protein [Nocardia sp. NRRL S-836]KOV85357.1 hypothetical protein ADL03_14585 [Nocardia sp. NRRL S-836]